MRPSLQTLVVRNIASLLKETPSLPAIPFTLLTICGAKNSILAPYGTKKVIPGDPVHPVGEIGTGVPVELP